MDSIWTFEDLKYIDTEKDLPDRAKYEKIQENAVKQRRKKRSEREPIVRGRLLASGNQKSEGLFWLVVRLENSGFCERVFLRTR